MNSTKLKPEQKQFFMELEALFEQPGWGHLVRGWKQELEALPMAGFFNAKTIEELEAYRQRYGLVQELLQLPETMAARKEVVIEENLREKR